MKLIRHILSHSILIGFVAMLVLGFYYRAVLFPVSWNEQISQQVDHIPGPYAAKLHAFAAPESTKAIPRVALAPSAEGVSEPSPVPAPEAVPAVVAVADDVPPLEAPVASEVVSDQAATEAEENDSVEVKPATEAVASESVEAKPAMEAVASETIEAKPVAETVATNATAEAKPAETAEEKPPVAAVLAKPVANTPPATAVEQTPSVPVVAAAPVAEMPSTAALEKTAPVTSIAETDQAVVEPAAKSPVEKPATITATATPLAEENKPATSDVAGAPANVAVPTPPATQDTASASTGEAANDDDTMATGSSDQDFVGINDLWRQARAAYGRGDMKTALQHYLALSEQESDNPDVFGELGNVYYARGNFPEAGEAYYEAAIRLLELGKTDQIHYLVRVIEGLSPDRAAKLKQRLVR